MRKQDGFYTPDLIPIRRCRRNHLAGSLSQQYRQRSDSVGSIHRTKRQKRANPPGADKEKWYKSKGPNIAGPLRGQ